MKRSATGKGSTTPPAATRAAAVVDCHSSPEGTLLKLIKTERNRFSVILHVDFAEREDAKR